MVMILGSRNSNKNVRKNRTPKISVIIPVYNVAKYLRACLDSVLEQTFQDWEAICIDDGSTDNSGIILDEYAAKDKRIKIIHQENKGVSAARNAGLDIAAGEWISFVDGDDWLDRDSYRQILAAAESGTPDVIMFGNAAYVEGGKPHAKIEFEEKKMDDFEYRILKQGGLVTNKIFKRKMLEENHLRFCDKLKVSEDGFFLMELFCHNPRVKFVKKGLYFYRIFRENSTMLQQDKIIDELLQHDLLSEKSFYQNASTARKRAMDIKILNNLLFRYNLLFPENKPENIKYLQEYAFYLSSAYSLKELQSYSQIKQLRRIINSKGRQESFWQKIFSIKNTPDKQAKIICILGTKFTIKK